MLGSLLNDKFRTKKAVKTTTELSAVEDESCNQDPLTILDTQVPRHKHGHQTESRL